jgi:PhnB protein
MAERFPIDQLDDLVTAILARGDADLTSVDPDLVSLAQLAGELEGLPSENFKSELIERIMRSEVMSSATPTPEKNVIRGVSTYLCFKDASAAIDFYKRAFGAKELMRLTEPSGKMGHAEIQIGDAVIKMSDEYPDYGAFSPQTLGGSPVRMHLDVENVDAFAAVAIAAGAKVIRPIADQFYGDRSGLLEDPFGYTWAVSSHIKDVPLAEMQEQLNEFARQQRKQTTVKGAREGFNSVTPYIIVQKPDELIAFVKQVFGAEETFRTIGSEGGTHAELRLGESMIMVGGHANSEEMPVAIHLYIPDVDQAYQRALAQGATSLFEPADQPYGERSGAIQDSTGNRWYLATTTYPIKEIAEEMRTVGLYFHPIGAPRFIDFLKNAFGAEELMRHDPADGMVLHAKLRIGDSVIELGEAREPSQPMPTAIYLYVENCDVFYEQALQAGATSLLPPTDQPYGDRNAWVKDPFDNVWYLATAKETGAGGSQREQ